MAVCRILYLFSGSPRKGSVKSWATKLAAKWGVRVQVDMVDIKVRPHLDLTKDSVQRDLLNKISAGYYAAIILSPPCSTFTRATFSNRKGPRHVRSYVHLRGLSRLTWTERKKANWGNTMTDFSFQVCKAVQNLDTMLIFENPEDLGAVQAGHYRGQRPASMWQWPAVQELLDSGKFQTCAFYQSDFGTAYLKPTRLFLKDFEMEKGTMAPGMPQFDDQGFYQGPLQRRQTEVQLIGQYGGKFTTAGTEQWPSAFCRWVAQKILSDGPHSTPFLPAVGEKLQMVWKNRNHWIKVTQYHNQRVGNYMGVMEKQGSAKFLENHECFTTDVVWPHLVGGT